MVYGLYGTIRVTAIRWRGILSSTNFRGCIVAFTGHNLVGETMLRVPLLINSTGTHNQQQIQQQWQQLRGRAYGLSSISSSPDAKCNDSAKLKQSSERLPQVTSLRIA